MDKQREEKIKQIDQMYEDIPSIVGNEHKYGMCAHHRELVAEALVNKGYGDVKQAQMEVLEKLKADLNNAYVNATTPFQAGKNAGLDNACNCIDELIKEVRGE